ncbi:unnamed protein product [Fraxinus pennsylvanica]|uniref:Protein kinase domain-containing protein n=1 Tax=Fraxinus pennsylvanica TaxID=56036 RepID=A0AAD2AJU8_9LAMI|nr:unnamed protein product [Fraxinus pennsylvanica]
MFKHRRRNSVQILKMLLNFASISLLFLFCNGGEFSESTSLSNFIRAVDPENRLRIDRNTLLLHPCSYKLKGIICDLRATTVVEIRLVNLSLTGILDVDYMCKLQNLRVLSLARNCIKGTIPNSISKCTSLRYLDLSRNSLSGNVPVVLTKLKNLRRLDISENHFTTVVHITTQKVIRVKEKPLHSRRFKDNFPRKESETGYVMAPISLMPRRTRQDEGKSKMYKRWGIGILVFLGFTIILLLVVLFLYTRAVRGAKETETLKTLAQSPSKSPPIEVMDEQKPEERLSELVFFVEKEEWFELEDLLGAAADLHTQSLWSSLYMVQLKNNAIYAVKRLTKLKVSFEEFGLTMGKIGNLKHQNILPLVGYNSTDGEKLLIYRYQKNGSLLTLFESYIQGERNFPWKLRLSMAVGIARGLDFIYRRFDDHYEIIPHGNIKLSNILLSDSEEPLISEYGYSNFLDQSLFKSNRYTAPEKTLSEKADVFSFGVILLELLTGKIVESGLDLPRWVKSMVRDEWTGEVFDWEVSNVEMYAFPLLNVSMNCVVNHPEDRPSIAEVLLKIEEVVSSQQD